MFFDRQDELAFLNSLLTRQRPSLGQMSLMYGRRRVGKTELLLQWAQQSGVEYVYWEAVKETATQQRTHLWSRLFGLPATASPIYRTWMDFWDATAQKINEKQKILILDELPYAADSDPAMLSSLQAAWDQYFQKSKTVIVLCGSRFHVMETLQATQSPLHGRISTQWELAPLPFSSLKEFFPKWSAEERVAAYAMVGGIPAYLSWLNPDLDLINNVREVILSPGSIFRAEPQFLISDEVRDPSVYLSIIKAIGNGAHTVTEISERAFIPSTSLSFYLNTLQDLHLVDRRFPVTQNDKQKMHSQTGRYHLSDPYFRFYFPFLEPFISSPPFYPEQVIERMKQNLRSFVGSTAFEDLARQWVRIQVQAGELGFVPEKIGSHWSRRVQIDVVAINRTTRDLLLGECKWGDGAVGRDVIVDLVEHKTPQLLSDILDSNKKEWKIWYVVFARTGFTQAAKTEMKKYGGTLVDLKGIEKALESGFEKSDK